MNIGSDHGGLHGRRGVVDPSSRGSRLPLRQRRAEAGAARVIELGGLTPLPGPIDAHQSFRT
jgi:hypothetical protein